MGAMAVVGTAADMQAGAKAHDGLEGRALASSADRAEWLRARIGRVTATEAAKIADGSQAARRALLHDKLHPEQVKSLEGNRYVDRGNAREAILARWLQAAVPGLRHNDVLYAGMENPRHAATPDVAGILQAELEELPAGTFVVGDIKTSKHDLDPTLPRGYFWTTTYMDQVQWQMYVCGARVAVFLWEQHDDQWPDPQPIDMEPRWVLIHYSPERVSRMIAQADLLLAELDAARAAELRQQTQEAEAKGEPVASVAEQAVISGEANTQVDVLGLTVLEARKEEATAKARKDTAWKRLKEALADRPSFSHTGMSKVTWTNEQTTVRVPDQEAALAAKLPDVGEDVTGQDLYDDYQRARTAWDEHQAKFWKDNTTESLGLTVTDPSKAKGGKR